MPDSMDLRTTVDAWVERRPWALVGAAAGAGLVLGAATHRGQLQSLTRMLTATASGVAVRLAINTLAEWLEPAPRGTERP